MNIKLPHARKVMKISALNLAKRAEISHWRLTQAELGYISLSEEELAKLEQALRQHARLQIEALNRICQ
jgi:hypothetical protein